MAYELLNIYILDKAKPFVRGGRKATVPEFVEGQPGCQEVIGNPVFFIYI
jgi:hypothetical protein